MFGCLYFFLFYIIDLTFIFISPRAVFFFFPFFIFFFCLVGFGILFGYPFGCLSHWVILLFADCTNFVCYSLDYVLDEKVNLIYLFFYQRFYIFLLYIYPSIKIYIFFDYVTIFIFSTKLTLNLGFVRFWRIEAMLNWFSFRFRFVICDGIHFRFDVYYMIHKPL